MRRLPHNLFSVWVLVGCAKSAIPTHGDASIATQSPGVRTLDVVPVLSRQLATTVRLQGELAPYASVAVFARVSGFVRDVVVDRGDVVHQGDALLTLVAPEMIAQRTEAQVRLHSDQMTRDRLRMASRTPGAVAGQELSVAEASVRADEARVASLRDMEGYLNVSAPIDGVVTERNVHPGALAGPSTASPLLRVEQVTRLRLTVAVPEQFAAEIPLGSTATFSVRAWPQVSFSGVIRRASRIVDTRTRTMPVELDVENADSRLAPGMFADVVWPVRRAGPSLFVPATAVVQSPERTFVTRLRDGVIDVVVVQRGIMLSDMVEVFGALDPGDLVVRRGTDELRAGSTASAHIVSIDGGAAR